MHHRLPNDFEPLQRLLALKRHEQPPPGYFDTFPQRVVARLKADAARPAEAWWQQWIPAWDLRPALAGAFAVAVGSVYFLGLRLADGFQPQAGSNPPPLAQRLYLAEPSPSARSFPVEFAHQVLDESATPRLPSSMDPVVLAAPPSGLFAPGAGLRGSVMDRASFRVRGN